MNKRHLLLGILLVLPLLAFGYDKRMKFVIEQVRTMEQIGSDAVGYAGAPDDFYLLYRYAWQASTDGDIMAMLLDPSPAVRVLGAKCLVTSPFRHVDPVLLNALEHDKTTLMVGPGGCVYQPMSVGDVVKKLKADPQYLGASVIPMEKLAKVQAAQ